MNQKELTKPHEVNVHALHIRIKQNVILNKLVNDYTNRRCLMHIAYIHLTDFNLISGLRI